METTINQQVNAKHSRTALWLGRIISSICVFFLLFDAIAKILESSQAVTGSVALGIPEHIIPAIGVVLLISTIIYSIPRTAILGAILLTGYLGGAIAIMLRAGQPLYFATVFGILVWLGLYLRNEKVRKFLF
ncbi:MAG TPA: DoxX family protein [Pedobacter sp.]|jgi:hypothetical protein